MLMRVGDDDGRERVIIEMIVAIDATNAEKQESLS
jgi:hypothetical protein